ncbi:MAG: hypothetical protein H6R14_797 [Proteobacteria bacterium]|nr:hypothetical protein [Pseudomonadota bacterium]
MRRLIDWLYRTLFGIHVRTHEQHIADLRILLDDLYLQAQTTDAEIEIVTRKLLDAKERRDEAARNAGKFVERRKSMIDDRFPDPIPRSY